MSRKPPTSADVASLAGVSRTTVSFVLNGRQDVAIPPATRQRVWEAAAALGYTPHGPARQLARGATRSLGLVLLQSPAQVVGDALLVDTLRGLVEAANEADYRVIVESLTPGSGRYADLLRARHADGLIVSGPRSDDDELRRLVADGYPVVLQGALDGFSGPSVDIDNEAAAFEAVSHLASLGHRRISCITNAPLVYTAASARLAGYTRAIAAAGLPSDPRLVAEADFDPASGGRALDHVVEASGGLPDAIFVASDVVALGVLGGLRARGVSVPDDVSVVAFDDISIAAFVHPALTTVRVPAHALGVAAGHALIARIGGDHAARRTLLPTELVFRESAAPRPAAGRPARNPGRTATMARAP